MARHQYRHGLYLHISAAAIAAVTAALFLPALKNGFVNWDDTQNLVNNPAYRGLGPVQLKWMFTTFLLGPYQPFSWMSLGLDYLLWGMDPFGYHLTNIVLHALTAAVFFLLCFRLFSASPASEKNIGSAALAAAAAALLFAAHPLRVESVAWVTERRDVLSGLFYLLTLLWYFAPRANAGARTIPWRAHLPPIAAFLLSLSAKGMGVSLPAALVLLDIYPLRRLPVQPWKWFNKEHIPVWLEKIPYLLLAGAFAFIGYLGQSSAGTVMPAGRYNVAEHTAEMLYGAVFYLYKTVVPVDLAPLYRFPESFVLMSWPAAGAGVVLLAITAAALSLTARLPSVPVAWFFYLAGITPILVLIRTLADRYTYIPCMGFAALAGAALMKAMNSGRWPVRAGAVLLTLAAIAALGRLTFSQEAVWRDSGTLWRHAVRLNPGSYLAHYNFGETLASSGRYDEAIAEYAISVQIQPNFPKTRLNLGVALGAKGMYPQAEAQYREALRLRPDMGAAHNGLGTALALQGRPAEAIPYYMEALRLHPASAETHNNLAAALASLGSYKEAERQYREALRLRPDYENARLNLADMLKALRR
jgi:Tfp pilus assembly protein PilF